MGKKRRGTEYSYWSKYFSDENLKETSHVEMEEKSPLIQKFPQGTRRSRFVNCILTFPYFIVLVSIIDVLLLSYAIFINKGFQPFSVNGTKFLEIFIESQENPLLGPTEEVLDKLGAKDADLILNQHEWWRFITPIFLHVGVFHLLANLFFQL